jgi:hypothetical protein
MRDYFSRLEGVPSYLETFTSSNASFYEKRGYKLIETDEVLGVKGYFMRRD